MNQKMFSDVSEFKNQEPEVAKHLTDELGDEQMKEIEKVWSDLEFVDPIYESQVVRKLDELKVRARKASQMRVLKRVSIAVSAAAILVAAVILLTPRYDKQQEQFTDQLETIIRSSSTDDVVIVMGTEEMTSNSDFMKIESSRSANSLSFTDGANSKNISNSNVEKISVNTPRGKIFTLTLPDGSVIMLNADTHFEYYSDFGTKDRRVSIRGEAYFDVADDIKRPFIVNISDSYYVTVLGTKFNVNSYNSDTYSTTTLVSGKVDVEAKGYKNVKLKPNDQFKIDFQNQSVDVKVVDPSEYTAWTQRMLYFDDLPLDQLCERLGRDYNITIHVDDKLKTLRFSGNINYDRGVEYVLKMIRTTCNVNYRIEDKSLFIDSL